jgi:hypothetical protein
MRHFAVRAAELADQLTALIGQQITITTTITWRFVPVEISNDEYDARSTPINRTTTGVVARVERSASLVTVWFQPRFGGGEVWLGTDRHRFLGGQPTEISVA